MRVVVGSVEEIPPGQRRIVAVEGRRGGIGVFNVGGTFYALRNRCPHKGGPLCEGRLRPYYLPSEVGVYAYEREGEILKCPWHEYEFEIKTGSCPAEPSLRVQTYPVTVEDGHLVVDVEE